MFWKIKYIIDDGYTRYKMLCIVIADTEEEALTIFQDNERKNLKGDDVILNEYTKISPCENGPIIYKGLVNWSDIS